MTETYKKWMFEYPLPEPEKESILDRQEDYSAADDDENKNFPIELDEIKTKEEVSPLD